MAFYPFNWRKVSAVIRHLANGRCEWCGCETQRLSTHHLGAPLATGDGWKPGDPRDKRDVRRENLAAICETCHTEVEPDRIRFHKMRSKRRARLERHRALGVGTGLIAIERQVA